MALMYFREMNSEFNDLLYKICLIFIDDFIGFGKTEEQFLNNAETILARVASLRLRLKANKCVMGVKELEVIGQILSPEGRRLSEKRVTALKNIRSPATYHELKMVLGALNTIGHDFIPNLSYRLKPINELLKGEEARGKNNHKSIKWSEECEQTFRSILDELTTDAVLAHPVPTEHDSFVVKTDASDYAIGGVVVLRNDITKKDRPVCFYSKSLTDTQQRWSPYEKELFSFVHCITQESYMAILKVCEFLWETDHRNLVYLNKMSEANDKLLHWKVIMQAFKFVVKHIAGSENKLPDALTRLVVNLIEQPAFINELTLSAS